MYTSMEITQRRLFVPILVYLSSILISISTKKAASPVVQQTYNKNGKRSLCINDSSNYIPEFNNIRLIELILQAWNSSHAISPLLLSLVKPSNISQINTKINTQINTQINKQINTQINTNINTNQPPTKHAKTIKNTHTSSSITSGSRISCDSISTSTRDNTTTTTSRVVVSTTSGTTVSDANSCVNKSCDTNTSKDIGAMSNTVLPAIIHPSSSIFIHLLSSLSTSEHLTLVAFTRLHIRATQGVIGLHKHKKQWSDNTTNKQSEREKKAAYITLQRVFEEIRSFKITGRTTDSDMCSASSILCAASQALWFVFTRLLQYKLIRLHNASESSAASQGEAIIGVRAGGSVEDSVHVSSLVATRHNRRTALRGGVQHYSGHMWTVPCSFPQHKEYVCWLRDGSGKSRVTEGLRYWACSSSSMYNAS
eukprot:GHVR01031139.1.p1 GENE.GHVR01031139.1~~GHVR01031139.1.p1  ORF type:complete len:425 (-),score=98.49 GHVR01031139.1:104-1378(-)